MKPHQIAELSSELSHYIIKLERAPTPTEIEKFIKGWITARQKGKLFVP